MDENDDRIVDVLVDS